MWHRVPQPKSVEHIWFGLSTQWPGVPAERSQVSVGMLHVTNPGFPHVERAAHRTAFPRHRGET